MPTPLDSKEFLETIRWEEKSKKKMLQPSDCIASWSDICGFGNMLEISSWDLQSLQNKNIIQLLNEFTNIAGQPFLLNIDPAPNDKIIILNDGIARTVDLKYSHTLDSYLLLMFLRDLIFSHYRLLKLTKEYNLGIRTILAGGERIQYSTEKITGHSTLYYDSVNISEFGKQFLNTTFVYNPTEFQMNTAFAKAFTIDSLGGKEGIKVNGLFIESQFFNKLTNIEGLTILKEDETIKLLNKETLVFELSIANELHKTIKGLNVLIYHIDKFYIHKEFDGDDLEFYLFR